MRDTEGDFAAVPPIKRRFLHTGYAQPPPAHGAPGGMQYRSLLFSYHLIVDTAATPPFCFHLMRSEYTH